MSDDRPKIIWPFNVVDIFAYLGQGFFFIIYIQQLISSYPIGYTSMLTSKSIAIINNKTIYIPILVIMSYTIGHIIAHIAYAFHEKFMVGKIIGKPSMYAFMSKSEITLFKKILFNIMLTKDYSNKYDEAFCSRLGIMENDASGKPIIYIPTYYDFRIIFSIVQENCPSVSGRLTVFLSLYSFSRNASFTFFFLGLITFLHTGFSELLVVCSFLAVSAMLFGRYLTFLRFYHDEVYLGYASYRANCLL